MNIHEYPDEHYWAIEAVNRSGHFLHDIAAAALRADADNYEIIRPAIQKLMKKYPKYSEGLPTT